MSTACWAASAESWRHRHESCSGHRYKLLHHILRVGHAGGGDFVLFQAAADGGGWRARAYAVAGIVSACQKPAADGSKCDGRCAGRGDLRGLRKHPSAPNGGFVYARVSRGRRSGTRSSGFATRAFLSCQSSGRPCACGDGGRGYRRRKTVSGLASVRRNDGNSAL